MSLLLGIESSCDETAAALVEDGVRVRSNVVATQHELHEAYAGVVPEIASRAHLERITPVVREAVATAGVAFDEVDAIAIGHRPGLIGSLVVGVSAAKALAWSLDVPVVGVDHVLSHLYAPALDDEPIEYPALGLVVSGGHTSLFHLTTPLEATCIGRTIDDAVGEAFDKASTILELGYPGGPRIDATAMNGDDTAHELPVAALGRDRLDFSYSGLKTSLLYAVRGNPRGRGADVTFPRSASDLDEQAKADFAASFQRAAIRPIIKNLERALDRHEARTLVIGGGVAANTRLRREVSELAEDRAITLRLPPMQYCLDNAAMIAGLAWWRHEAGEHDDLTLSASARSALV